MADIWVSYECCPECGQGESWYCHAEDGDSEVVGDNATQDPAESHTRGTYAVSLPTGTANAYANSRIKDLRRKIVCRSARITG